MDDPFECYVDFIVTVLLEFSVVYSMCFLAFHLYVMHAYLCELSCLLYMTMVHIHVRVDLAVNVISIV